MPSFENKKQLRFVITLATGTFGASDNNVIMLQGFRASVDIDKAGGMQNGTLRARIYGVKQSDMNGITTLAWKPSTLLIRNKVRVYALDGATEALVFAGNIVNAWGDYQSIPEVFLHIQAQAAVDAQLIPVPPRSFKGVTDVATVAGQIAADMGYIFENNGVTAQLADVYLANTGMEQMRDLVRAAGCDMYLDDDVLAITPKNEPRAGDIPLISPQSGLVGYPTFDASGVYFQTLFNPAITFGGRIKLQTDIQQANGEWIVNGVAHRLESERPGGAWFSNIKGSSNNYAITH